MSNPLTGRGRDENARMPFEPIAEISAWWFDAKDRHAESRHVAPMSLGEGSLLFSAGRALGRNDRQFAWTKIEWINACGISGAESLSTSVVGHRKRNPIMKLMDAIFGRRSVRNYRPDPVPRETITRLIEAAIHAPSAINQQPWSFSVVRDPPLLDQISHDAKAHMLNVRPAALPAHLYESLGDPDFHVFYHAPVLIVISAIERGPWIAEDCALAAENLMLAAHDMGLGSCWIGLAQAWLDTPKGKERLGIPDSHVVVAPIIVGIPRAAPPAVPRKDPEVRWIG